MYYKNSIVWSQIKIEDTPIHILGVYLTPTMNDEVKKSMNMLDYIIQERIFKNFQNSRIILAGDFNFHLRNVRARLLKLGLQPVFDQSEATHNRGNQIDQIFTNIPVAGKDIVEMDPVLTDHKQLLTKLRVTIHPNDLNLQNPPLKCTQN